MNLYSALYKPFISKALRYDPCITRGSHSFTCHPHTNHTCLHSQQQGVTSLRLVQLHECCAEFTFTHTFCQCQCYHEITVGILCQHSWFQITM